MLIFRYPLDAIYIGIIGLLRGPMPEQSVRIPSGIAVENVSFKGPLSRNPNRLGQGPAGKTVTEKEHVRAIRTDG